MTTIQITPALRIAQYNASVSGELLKWKIQKKRGGIWKDFRIQGAVKMFDNHYHAENYAKLMIK